MIKDMVGEEKSNHIEEREKALTENERIRTENRIAI